MSPTARRGCAGRFARQVADARKWPCEACLDLVLQIALCYDETAFFGGVTVR